MRFVAGILGNRKPVPCDFVCEGIFASACFGRDTETDTSTFLLIFKKGVYFEPIDEGAPHQT
jgi:hypothetical protein